MKAQEWKRVGRGANALVVLAAVVGILVLLNLLASGYRVRLDLTLGRQYQLSPQTREVLKSLTEPVKVTAFLEEGSPFGGRIRDLLEEYDYASPRLKAEFVDPEKDPSKARAAGIESYDTTVFECGGRTKKVPLRDTFQFGETPDLSQIQFTGEQAFTRALIAVTRASTVPIYFLEGHDELGLYEELTSLKGELEGEGYKVDSLNLPRQGRVPSDCKLLVIAGPRKDLDQSEVAGLKEYLAQGGKLLVFVDPLPGGPRLVRLGQLLATVGVRLDEDVVVDPERCYFFDPISPVPGYSYHDVTRGLIDHGLAMVLPQARSLRPDPEYKGDLVVEKLLWASNQAWGETNVGGEVGLDDADVKSPLMLAVTVATPSPPQPEGSSGAGQEPPQGEPRALVVGDASFISNEVVGFQGNLDFVLNAVGWLCGQRETVSIRPRDPQFRQVFLSGPQARWVFYGTVVVLPVAVLLAGGLVWLRRRTL
ncbi:MAG: GldG family protein [Acetobacteraceae bacterium]|nr:GldG family protein [Acetobacteraceae bacterium]